MSDRNEKYRQKYLQTLSQRVGEPAEAVGVFSRPGSMNSLMVTKVSPLAGMLLSKKNKGRTGGLPQNVVVGVTPTRVYVFAYKPSGTSFKLKDPLAVFDRTQVRAEVTGRSMAATRVRFTLPDGDQIELDSNRMPGSSEDFNAPVVAALGG